MTFRDAAQFCRSQGGRLCSRAEVSAAQAVGAQWCCRAWVADRLNNSMGFVSYPMQAPYAGCWNTVGVVTATVAFDYLAGANCCRP